MGSRLFAVDMLLSLYINPMHACYQYGKYQQACIFLYRLNSFFKGYGIGIDDLPAPENKVISPQERVAPDQYYLNYFHEYAPLIDLATGKYIHDVLEKLQFEKELPPIEH